MEPDANDHSDVEESEEAVEDDNMEVAHGLAKRCPNVAVDDVVEKGYYSSGTVPLSDGWIGHLRALQYLPDPIESAADNAGNYSTETVSDPNL